MDDKELSEKRVKPRSKIRIILAVVFICIMFSTSFVLTKNNKVKHDESSAANIKSPAQEVKPPIDNNKDVDENNSEDNGKKDDAGKNDISNSEVSGPQVSNEDTTTREATVLQGVNMDQHISQLGTANEKVAYLTFDDGPSRNVTPKILDILDRYKIKATFFVIGKMALENKDVLLREKGEGEEIGDHSFTHDYKYEYATPQNIVDDFNKGADAIRSILGKDYIVKYARFPGGSFGVKLEPFRTAVEKAGYSFIDWNSLSGDAEGNNIPPSTLVENVKKTSAGHNTLVMLMHDAATKETTVQALPAIIEYLKSQGYIFKIL